MAEEPKKDEYDATSITLELVKNRRNCCDNHAVPARWHVLLGLRDGAGRGREAEVWLWKRTIR